MVAKSSFATDRALSILSSASRRVSSITAAPCLLAGDVRLAPSFACRTHQRADFLPADRSQDFALSHQVEDDDRKVVVLAQADRGGVHDLEVADQHLAVVEVVKPDRVGILAWVRVV